MREIEFRGLTVNNGWVYGDLRKDMPNSTVYYNEYSQRICWEYSNAPVRNGTIGQYTGFKDKNEKKIYEGDKLEFTVFDYNGADSQYKGVVTFADGEWQIWNDVYNEFYGVDGAFHLHWVASQDEEIEVIGNIHDNPELIK